MRRNELTRFRWERSALAVFLFCIAFAGYGQEQWEREGEGEIRDVEIEITKERQLTLPRANRNFEKVPPRPHEPIVPAITYDFRNLSFSTPDHQPVVRPLRLKQEELPKMDGNYVSGGLGNYSSFMLDGSASTKRDKNKLLGAEFYWRTFGKGPVDGDNSANSATRLKLYGKLIGTDVTGNAHVSYQNNRAYFYGYDPGIEIDRNQIKQVYEVFEAYGGIENTRKADVNFQLNSGYSHLRDLYVTTEGEFSMSFSGDYKLKGTNAVVLVADVFSMNRTNAGIAEGRTLFRFKPAYQFMASENLQMKAGINLAVQNDALAGDNSVHFFPVVSARYSWSKEFAVYGSVSGDMDKVNLHTLAAENSWVDPANQLNHTTRAIDLDAGIAGSIQNKITYKAGASVATLKNQYFYQGIRNTLDPAGVPAGIAFDKFNVVYDGARRINPYGEVSYSHANVAGMTLRMDYFAYTTDSIAQAWHRPSYRAEAIAHWNLYEKIHLQAGFIAQGGMKAFDSVSGVVVTLEPAVDLSFRGRYFFSRQISAFIHLDNMFANSYPIYSHYPSRGFQALLGMSWSF